MDLLGLVFFLIAKEFNLKCKEINLKYIFYFVYLYIK